MGRGQVCGEPTPLRLSIGRQKAEEHVRGRYKVMTRSAAAKLDATGMDYINPCRVKGGELRKVNRFCQALFWFTYGWKFPHIFTPPPTEISRHLDSKGIYVYGG